MNRDLTVGRPELVLWRFCLPLFGSILFQQLYNIADSLVAGKFIGESALAAVGNSYEITLIFIAFAFGCNMGCSVVVSSFFGAKRYDLMKTAVSTAMITSALVCCVLMAFGLLCGSGLLELIHTPRELMTDSLLYLNIYVLGLPFVFFYNISTGIFSAMGDSRTPFWFLAASSTANIAMDILFVTVFHMGVSGVAWATFLCQGVSCILALSVVLRRLRGIETKDRAALFDRVILEKFIRIAVPSVLQQSFISLGNIIIQSVINGFGGGVIAGYAAGVKLNNLVITSFTTLCNGISNFTAQNLGAQKIDRVRSGFLAGLKIVWLLSLPLFLLYFFAVVPKQIIHRHAEEIGKRLEQRDIGKGFLPFPFGHRCAADSQSFRQSLLRKIFFFAQSLDVFTDVHFHDISFGSESRTSPTPIAVLIMK